MKLPESARPHEVAPTVSILISTFRRKTLLEAILRALAPQIKAVQALSGGAEGNRSYVEVIVVDNCPNASAREVCERNAARIPILIFIHMPVPGVVNARNAAVSAAAGDYVIFLDDDEIPRPDWLHHWLSHAAMGVDAAFGPVLPCYETEPGVYRAILDRMFSRYFHEPTGTNITRQMIRLGTGNSLFRRARLNGGRTFDLRFNCTGGEDLHMIGQLIKAGTPLIWNREAAVDEIVSAEQNTPSYIKRRRFNQAQLRCVLALRAGGLLAWPWIAILMFVGVAQTLANGACYMLATATGGARREPFAIDVQGGLGKIFWYRRKTVPLYARALLGSHIGHRLREEKMLGEGQSDSAYAQPTDDILPELSVIVVSYNTVKMTLACLDSVVAETQATAYEIVVIDNASSDSSADAIAAAYPEIRLIRSDENMGFARANNVAAEVAKGDLLLLLNPDTVVLDAAIDRLVTFARARPEAQIWGGRTVFGDGSLNSSSCWRRMTLWNLFCRAAGLTGLFPESKFFNAEAYGGWKRDTEREVDIVTGCFFLIERRFWKKLHGFDPMFFMYGEEADLCLRARCIGARPRVTPNACIVHYGGASETVRAEQIIRVSRAKVSLLARHMPAHLRTAAIFLFKLWPLSRMIGYRVAMLARPGKRFAGEHATWSEIWRRRREWQNGFERNDTSKEPLNNLSNLAH